MRNPIVTESVDRFSTQDMAKISCKTLAKGLSTDQFSTELFFLKKKLEILKTKITQFHQRVEGEVSTRNCLTWILSLYYYTMFQVAIKNKNQKKKALVKLRKHEKECKEEKQLDDKTEEAGEIFRGT